MTKKLYFLLLSFLLGTLLFPGLTKAANFTITGIFELTPAFKHISVYSSFFDDDNGNNQVVLEYREVGAIAWKRGIDMTVDRRNELMLLNDDPIANSYKNQWRAIIFGLKPDTNYEVRVTYTDPDEVTVSLKTAKTKTRNDNPSSNGNIYYVSNSGSDSKTGSLSFPWKTIQYAANNVQAGDKVYIMPGVYNEQVIITKSGTASNYITFQSYNLSDKVVVNSDQRGTFRLRGASYIRVEGLDLRNTKYASVHLSDSANNNIIEDNILSGSGTSWWAGGVVVSSNSANTLIQENEISTTATSGEPMGILLYKTGGGTVIRNNSIIGSFYDGIGGAPNFGITGGPYKDSYIYNNYIEGTKDDGIEAEGGGINVAIWGNTVKGNRHMSFGIAPVIVGPMYIFRNTLIGDRDAAVKMGSSSSGFIYFYHNTIYNVGAQGIATYGSNSIVYNVVFRNNIVYPGGYTVEEMSGPGEMNFDYNCMYTTKEQAIKWTNNRLPWLDWRDTYNQEENGVWGQPQFVNPADDDFHLKLASPCIDKGVILPGFNDQNSAWYYMGVAPDMGAYEYDSGSLLDSTPQESSDSGTNVTPLEPETEEFDEQESVPSDDGGVLPGGGRIVTPPEEEHTKSVSEINTEELQAQIQWLLAEITKLQILLLQLQQGEGISGIPATYKFTKYLYFGHRSKDVEYLQEFLKSQGSEIYSEGLVTGYFGSLTYGAVVRFQLKHGVISSAVEKGAGFVGPETRPVINQILGK